MDTMKLDVKPPSPVGDLMEPTDVAETTLGRRAGLVFGISDLSVSYGPFVAVRDVNLEIRGAD